MEQKKRVILLMGRKLGMAQMLDASGNFVPVTAIDIAPCPVVRLKSSAVDGYDSVQIAAEATSEHRLTGATLGHLRRNGCGPHRHLRELRLKGVEGYAAGEVFDVSLLQVGERVDISGITKGRGFQGVMKRHGFSGGPASHGSMFHRRGGSYGQREEPGRIYPGRKMPGHMGSEKRTMQNLTVVRINPEQNLLFVRGSVAGSRGGLVAIRTAKKG
jgi:large subunit ribosomal protein L3